MGSDDWVLHKMKNPKKHATYTITHIKTGLVYVGKTHLGKKRFYMHQRSKTGSKLTAAMQLWGIDEFIFRIVREYDTSEQALQAERELISLLNTIWPNGFNLQSGGPGSMAPNLSDEERATRRAGQLNKIVPEETRKKIKDSWQRNYSERVQAISEANRRVACERKEKGIPHPAKGKTSPFKRTKRGPYGKSRIKPETNEKRSASLKLAYENPELRRAVGERSKAMWAARKAAKVAGGG